MRERNLTEISQDIMRVIGKPIEWRSLTFEDIEELTSENTYKRLELANELIPYLPELNMKLESSSEWLYRDEMDLSDKLLFHSWDVESFVQDVVYENVNEGDECPPYSYNFDKTTDKLLIDLYNDINQAKLVDIDGQMCWYPAGEISCTCETVQTLLKSETFYFGSDKFVSVQDIARAIERGRFIITSEITTEIGLDEMQDELSVEVGGDDLWAWTKNIKTGICDGNMTKDFCLEGGC